MTQPTFTAKLPYRIRCNLPDCGKAVNLTFTKVLDNIPCRFCSPDHAKLGEARWVEKKEKNIRLGVEPNHESQDEYVGDNTEEFIERR